MFVIHKELILWCKTSYLASWILPCCQTIQLCMSFWGQTCLYVWMALRCYQLLLWGRCLYAMMAQWSNKSHKCMAQLWDITAGLLRDFHLSLQWTENTIQCVYNTFSFIWNTLNRHPIARWWGWAMGCPVWVETLIYVPLHVTWLYMPFLFFFYLTYS